jgi:hypothetical protein
MKINIGLVRSDAFIAKLFALGAAVYAIFIAFEYSGQLPLEMHSFRQSQTALTIYWFLQDGFKLAYETPVGGPPWSIPFEFPLYQGLVAIFTWLTGQSIEVVARLTSFVFLLSCLPATHSIVKNLKLPESVSYIFAALVLSSPVYLYWGRTIMIETTALFFAIMSIKFFVDGVTYGWSKRTIVLYLLFMIVAILQKATTGLPVVAVLAIVYAVMQTQRVGLMSTFLNRRYVAKGLMLFILPVAIGIIWTLYTDQVKSQSVFGRQLTSSALSAWNWGSLGQRFSLDLFEKVIWIRLIQENLAGYIGLLLLGFTAFSKKSLFLKYVFVSTLSLVILPLLIFTNLHIVHNYYQAANLVFLIFALALALGAVVAPAIGSGAVAVALTIIFVLNYSAFNLTYADAMKRTFSRKDTQSLEIASALQRQVPVNSSVVIFGHDWNSDIAYLSQRKSFTVPVWFDEYEEISANPERFVGNSDLGAVLLCPEATEPTLSALLDWTQRNKAWKVGRVGSCYLATPGAAVPDISTPLVDCVGGIDDVAVTRSGGQTLVSIGGWLAPASATPKPKEQIFMAFSADAASSLGLGKQGSRPLVFDTLRSSRLDANSHLKLDADADLGFNRSVLLAGSGLAEGEYTISLIKSSTSGFETCRDQRKKVRIEKSAFNAQ